MFIDSRLKASFGITMLLVYLACGGCAILGTSSYCKKVEKSLSYFDERIERGCYVYVGRYEIDYITGETKVLHMNKHVLRMIKTTEKRPALIADL